MIRSRSVLHASRSIASAVLAGLLTAGLLPVPAGVDAAPVAGPSAVAQAAGSPATTADDGLPGGTIADLTERADAPALPVANAPGGGGLDPAGPGVVPAQHPSIAYEEAMAHENDHITFQPGARVTKGFKPRSDDRWPVGGQAPVPLPAGRASGREMAASAQGSEWARIGSPGVARDRGQPSGPDTGSSPNAAPVDAPAGRPATAASGVAYMSPSNDAAADPSAASGLRRQVFGFLPYWELSGASTKVNYDMLSTIAYFSVGADSAGNLRKRTASGARTTGWAGWTSSNLTSVISNAHQRGTRVVLTISVFAWTTSQANVQRAILGSAAARLNLARQAAAAVRDRGADGINLDFEPLASGYESQFVALLKTLRAQLNRIRSGYQITYDTTGYIGNYPLEASVGASAADAIFVMGYDYRTASSSTAGSVDPLSGPTYDLADTVRAYTARVSPSRVILGIPWYGRAWSTQTDGVRSRNISGARNGYSTAVNYESIVALIARYGRRWDSSEQSPYIVYRRRNCTSTYGCVTSWRQVYYDDATSMKRRYALVNDYGLRGAGLWALGYDGGRSELYRAISESFLVDKSAPLAGIDALPTTQLDEGFLVRWSARDTSSVVSYDVQASVDGGAWRTWLTRTKTTSDVWPGRDGHTYAFRVRATDSKGNVGSWNTTSNGIASPQLAVGGFGRVIQDGLTYRTGPDTSAARLGKLPKGTILAITRGPVASDGYTWWEVTEPIREWGPVSFVERGVWVASGSASSTFVAAYRAPNSTTVDAGLRGFDFGFGASAVGTGAGAVSRRSFSPDGDGSGDLIRLRWTNTVTMDSLALNVYRTNGVLVGSRRVPDLGAGAQTWDWNGKVAGAAVPDGRYILQLAGTAGSRSFHAPAARPVTASQVGAYAVTVDTVAPRLASSSATRTILSPNGDGRKDRIRLRLSATGATRWAVRIVSASGSTVRTASGSGGSIDFTWTGTSNAGERVPDGRYTATLAGYDDAGNAATRAWALTVDTRSPTVTLSASGPAFSPNGDHAADSAALSWASSEHVWGTARIWKGSRLIRSWTVRGQASGTVTWDGTDSAGHKVADGRYTFRVDVRDLALNRTVVARTIVVDRTPSYLRWSGSFFPQDADALGVTSTLTWRLSRSARTTLRLYDAGGHLVRTVWSGRALAAGRRHWTWNGKLPDGSYAPVGSYEARLTVTSSLGTLELRRDVWAAPYLVTPSASRLKAGQTLSVTFTSVEPLGGLPSVRFTQPGRSVVTVRATRLSSGAYRASFRVRSGPTGKASLQISAKDSGGRVNQLTVPIRVIS